MKNLFLLFLFPFYLYSATCAETHPDKNFFKVGSPTYKYTNFYCKVYNTDDIATCYTYGQLYQEYTSTYYSEGCPAGQHDWEQQIQTMDWCSNDLVYLPDERRCANSCPDGQESFNGKCIEACEEGFQRNDEGICEEIPQEPEGECNEGYTLTTGYTTLLPSRCNSCITNQTCLDAYTLRQMTDSEEQLCCIKFDNPDDEVEAPENPDNNATPLDLNPTNEILEDIRDDANLNADQLEQEEQETRARLEEVKEILAGIQTDNSEHATADTSNNNANTDRTIQNDNTNANQAHQDQVTNQGKYDDIILGLREVKDATTNLTAHANANSQREIDNANANAEQAHTDAQNSDAQNQENADRNHEDLEGIKDSIDNLGNGENFTGELTQAIDGLSNIDGMIEEGRESIIEAFNGMVVDYTGLTPVFTATGDCVESFEVFGTTIELDFNFFATAKFAFDIIFTLLLAFMTFKIYFFIFISLTQKA